MRVYIAQFLDQTGNCAARLSSCYRSGGNHLATRGFWRRDYQGRGLGWDGYAQVIAIRAASSPLRRDIPRLWGLRIASAEQSQRSLFSILFSHGLPHTTRSTLTRADLGFVMRCSSPQTPLLVGFAAASCFFCFGADGIASSGKT